MILCYRVVRSVSIISLIGMLFTVWAWVQFANELSASRNTIEMAIKPSSVYNPNINLKIRLLVVQSSFRANYVNVLAGPDIAKPNNFHVWSVQLLVMIYNIFCLFASTIPRKRKVNGNQLSKKKIITNREENCIMFLKLGNFKTHHQWPMASYRVSPCRYAWISPPCSNDCRISAASWWLIQLTQWRYHRKRLLYS